MLVADHINSKYGDFANVPSESHDGIAINFCTQYYYIRAHFSGEIHRFYKNDSSLDMHQKHLVGKDAIQAGFSDAWVNNTKNFISSLNCCAISPELVCIMSSGTVVKEGAGCKNYSEAFVLQKYSNNVYYIKSQILHFLNEENVVSDTLELNNNHLSMTKNNSMGVRDNEDEDESEIVNNGIDLHSHKIIDNNDHHISDSLVTENNVDFKVTSEGNNNSSKEPGYKSKTWAQRADTHMANKNDNHHVKNGMRNGTKGLSDKQQYNLDHLHETSETSSSISPPGLSNTNATKTIRSGGRTSKLDEYPNNRQLFIGNLPFDLDNERLIDFFSRFGNVIDLQIIPTQNRKNVPNFGFIVFDSETAVKEILDKRPHFINGTQRINVEAKKPASYGYTGGGFYNNNTGGGRSNRYSGGGGGAGPVAAMSGSLGRNYGN